MKVSKEIINLLKKNGVNFFLSVPCKLLSNMIMILEKDKDIFYSSVPREEEGVGIELIFREVYSFRNHRARIQTPQRGRRGEFWPNV